MAGNLSYDEFWKPETSKRPNRRMVLINGIKSGITFDITPNGKMVFPLDKNNNAVKELEKLTPDKSKFANLQLTGSDGKKYKISNIKKTDIFGGGGGARGGSDLTAITESGQCYVCSLLYNVLTSKSSLEYSDLTYDNLKKASQYCDTGSTKLEEILEKSPPDWMQSYIKVANILYKNFKFEASKKVYIHRDSSFHKKIFEYKSQTLKNDKKSNNPQAPGTFDNNKWNPGDIWMTTLRTLPELPTDSWSSLNSALYELSSAPNRKLLGVSLKKIERTPHIEEYNKPMDVKPRYTLDGFTISPQNPKKGEVPFFSSIDMYLVIDGTRVQFRATSGSASKPSWQGEISGSSAAAGKIGGGNVNFFLKKNYKKTIFKDSESELVSEVISDSEKFWKDFYGLYVELFPGGKLYNKLQYKIGDKPVTYESFKELALERNKKTESFVISKYMNMKLLDVLMSGSGSQLNGFASDLFLYGSSNTDQSSYFIKISD
jgi:hypothetical protein